MPFIPAAKAERALSLLPALIMHRKRAAQTPVLLKLDVKTCPLGANGAIKTLWRETLQALIRRQNDPLVRPSHVIMMALKREARRWVLEYYFHLVWNIK